MSYLGNLNGLVALYKDLHPHHLRHGEQRAHREKESGEVREIRNISRGVPISQERERKVAYGVRSYPYPLGRAPELDCSLLRGTR